MTPSSTGPERLSGVTAIILAAGVGSRMGAAEPKVLHPLLGRPMALWVLESIHTVVSDPAILLLSPATAALHALAPKGTLRAEQPEPRGTGDAVRCAIPVLPAGATEVLIACGDTPLIVSCTHGHAGKAVQECASLQASAVSQSIQVHKACKADQAPRSPIVAIWRPEPLTRP